MTDPFSLSIDLERDPEHDESKLPKWAQARLCALRKENERFQDRYARLEMAHSLLAGKEWFHLITMEDGVNLRRDPRFPDAPGYRHLWFMEYDDPRRLCSLGDGDTLIVGRAKRWYEKEGSA